MRQLVWTRGCTAGGLLRSTGDESFASVIQSARVTHSPSSAGTDLLMFFRGRTLAEQASGSPAGAKAVVSPRKPGNGSTPFPQRIAPVAEKALLTISGQYAAIAGCQAVRLGYLEDDLLRPFPGVWTVNERVCRESRGPLLRLAYSINEWLTRSARICRVTVCPSVHSKYKQQ